MEKRSGQKEVAPKKKSAGEQEGDKGDDGDKKDKKGKDDGGKNKKLKGAKAAAKQEGADAQAGKTGVDLDDLEFDKVFSTCTAETNARFQITAHVRDAHGDKHRLHIATLSKKGYGHDFATYGKRLVAYCERGRCTRRKAVLHKDKIAVRL